MKRPLVILTGPTAVGKTSLSIKLAKQIGGSIVSCDSMQVYRKMDIGSAKIRPEQMEGIPHYLIDILDPDEEFHVSRFCDLANEAVHEIYAYGRIPILTGGTGFYLHAFRYGSRFDGDGRDDTYRALLEKKAEEEGNDALYQKLLMVDPQAARKIHPNNRKRMIRALEYHHLTGGKISDHNESEQQRPKAFNDACFVLTCDRAELYRRIEKRVDRMMQEGLLSEVSALAAEGLDQNSVSMQGLGYKQLLQYLDGECTLDEAVSNIKRDTRHFAKRQLTWFRSEPDTVFIDKDDFDWDEERILAFLLKELEEKKIL